ncbi:MAG: glutamine amidotransferase [Methylotenera sp.]
MKIQQKIAIVIRHLLFENLGTIQERLVLRGYEIRYIDAGVDKLGINLLKADLIIVLGGPVGAYEVDEYPFLRDELSLIKLRLESNLPILGICLGAQLIARALGAKVQPMGFKEIGFYPVQLTHEGLSSVLKPLIENSTVLHWHGDQFEIPSCATRLAESRVCKNQAFSIGKNVLCLQFHLELDPDRIEQWLIGHALELSITGIQLNQLREHAYKFGPTLKKQSEIIFENWLNNLT